MKLRPAKPHEVDRVLKRMGFERIRQKGSHGVYYHPDGRWTTLAFHAGRDLPKGTLRNIIKDLKITVEEFEKLR